jgi:hypothetical protein
LDIGRSVVVVAQGDALRATERVDAKSHGKTFGTAVKELDLLERGLLIEANAGSLAHRVLR